MLFHNTCKSFHNSLLSEGDCMDDLPEKDCQKIVKKEKCADKGYQCKMSCDMCGDEMTEPPTTAAGGGGGGR
jgi:hypothetical protein